MNRKFARDRSDNFGAVVMTLLFVLVALVVFSSCSSRSGKRNEGALRDVFVYKSDLTQVGEYAEFCTYDTVNYVVIVKGYKVHLTHVINYSEDLARLIVATRNTSMDKTILLNIK